MICYVNGVKILVVILEREMHTMVSTASGKIDRAMTKAMVTNKL